MARTTKDWDDLLLLPAAAAQLEPASSLLSQPDTPLISSSAIGDRLRYLPTGLPTLDNLGGIRLQSVTEVVGRSGAGKTQLALQMVVMAAKYNQGAMYIDTEKKLILERLRDMAARRVPHQEGDYDDRFPRGMSSTSFNDPQDPNDYNNRAQHERLFSFKAADQVLQNMTVKQPHSTQELLNVLEAVEEEILVRNQQSTSFPVRLLIVDSIAAPLKRDFGPHSIPQRAATAFSIAQTLKRLAEQLHLAVIVINQVGIDGQQQQQQHGATFRSDQMAVRASLGTSWHHCVSTRILVDHDVDPHRDANSTTTTSSQAQNSHHRRLNVVKSNWMPPLAFPFTITPVGIVEL
jgi:RecA/RadA recombinase